MKQVNQNDSSKDRQRFIQFLNDEKCEIERYKWIESEKLGYDVGDESIMDWVEKYAASYRKWWDEVHK